MPMGRMAFGCLMAAAATLGALSLPAAAADIYTLKLSTFFPPNYVLVSHVLNDWAHELDEKSGGRLKIEIYPAAQMGPPPRHFDLARTGVADIAIASPGNNPGRFPLSEIIELPFVTRDSRVTSQVLMDLVPDYLAKEHAGTRILWAFVSPPFQIDTRSKPIRKIADLQGLRLRHQSELSSDILSAFGVTPVNVMPGDIADALDKGTIDGAIFSYDGVEAFRVVKMVKYATEASFSTAAFVTVMNDASYAGLPADLKKILDDSTGMRMTRLTAAAMDANDAHGKQLMLDSGDEILPLDPGELDKAKALAAPVTERYLAALEAKGLPARKMYEQALALTAKYEAEASAPK